MVEVSNTVNGVEKFSFLKIIGLILNITFILMTVYGHLEQNHWMFGIGLFLCIVRLNFKWSVRTY